MNKLIPIALLGLFTSACGGSDNQVVSKEGEVTSSISAGSQSEQELEESLKEIHEEEEKRMAEEKANSTTLSFDKLTHDFGDVAAETENTTTFTVTNTGDKPLIIADVSASCGCTMPKKPEAPIAPGESDEIQVKFKSKPGQMNEIKKTITVRANTMDKVHLLEIRAFVK